MIDKGTRTFTVTLPLDLYKEIEKMAKKELRSKAAQIVHLLKIALEKDK